jgi:vitamin B12 transporter
LNLSALYTGERYNSFSGSQQKNTGPLNDYVLVDFSGSYKLSDEADIFLRVDNVLDADYQEILNFGTAGRSAYAGLRAKF